MKLLFFILISATVVLTSAKAFTTIKDKPKLQSHNENSLSFQHEEAIDLLSRLTREAVSTKLKSSNQEGKGGRGGAGTCKYRKGKWSACDPETKARSRTFTLKKGDTNVCELTKTLQKECKGGRKGGKQRNNNAKNRNRNEDKPVNTVDLNRSIVVEGGTKKKI